MPEGSKNINYYIEIANDMIEKYHGLRIIQEKLDDMSHLKWARPEGMDAKWMRDFKTTAPYDAIRAGVRVLSGLEEDITIDPYAFPEVSDGNLLAAKVKANAWETVLRWQMDRASRRRAILRQDVTRSALMYDEVVGQVVHLPTQIKAIKKLGGNPNRQQAALRYGDFVINLRNPKSVYTRYSDYMLEAVLYAVIKNPRDIQAFWNNSELGRLIDEDEAAEKWVFIDYVDYYRHVVFCYPGTTVSMIRTGGGSEDEDAPVSDTVIELMNEPWEMDFLPWAAVIGGTMLDSDPENSRFPLLYGIHQADQWNNTNILGTLMMSEAIAKAAAPSILRQGIQPDSVRVRYGVPGGTLDVPSGHTAEQLRAQPLDPALREAIDRQLQDMSRATIPSVLVTAEALPDEPFAGFNQRIQQAMASLMPFKFLAERWFEEAYRLMLYWSEESNLTLSGYNTDEDGLIQVYEIMPGEIIKDGIYLKVELQADVPIDKAQRMNTAIQASEALKLPTRDILEMLGETDPERKMKEWMMEQMDLAYFQGILQHIQFQSQQAIEEMLAQAQLQQQAQMAQQQIEQQAAAAQEQAAAAGGAGPQGQGANTAQGGQPGDIANPGATSPPQATGQSFAGEEVE